MKNKLELKILIYQSNQIISLIKHIKKENFINKIQLQYKLIKIRSIMKIIIIIQIL
jgi:hypothetical protein